MSAVNAHAQYHANPALGGSTVAKAATGCLRDALLSFAGSDAARIGSCVDLRWIERKRPAEVYSQPPAVNRRTKEGKAAFASWQASAESRGLYTFDRTPEDCIARVEGAVSALSAHRRAEAIRAHSEPQKPIFWTEDTPRGPLECKGLIDLLPTVGGASDLVDLKTTASDIGPRSVRNLILSRGYDYQLAHYRRGLAANGVDVDQVMLIFAQSVDPFGVEVYEISEGDIIAADAVLVDEVYPRIAAYRAGVETYTGHGEAAGGLEPCHLLEINRRD